MRTSGAFQGAFKKVLCVCSMGLLRSPTAALVLSMPPFNFNTRSVGIDQELALIPVSQQLISWADEIVCMTREQQGWLKHKFSLDKTPTCLDISDDFEYRNTALMHLIAERYGARTGGD